MSVNVPSIDSAVDVEQSINRTNLGRISQVAFVMSIGVFLVAVGYSRGRSGKPYSAPIYWIGDGTILFAPMVILIARKAINDLEGAGIAVLLSVATYAVKECYVPLNFTFSDEFQHVPTLLSILSTHHLFHANPQLPVSPLFPGLEIATSAIIDVTHLSMYSAAAILLGFAHLLATLGLYYLIRELHPSVRVAAFVVIVYASGPDYQFFTSYFAYESLGLPYLILGLLSLLKAIRSPSVSSFVFWCCINLLCTATCVVTHHISSYVLALFEVAIVGIALIGRGDRNFRWSTAMPLAIGGGYLAYWDFFVARPVLPYLRHSLSRLLLTGATSLRVNPALVSIAGKPFLSVLPASVDAPTFDRVTAYAWAVVLTLGLAAGLRLMLRNWRQTVPLSWPIAIASPVLVAAFAIQALAPGGGEVGSRLLAFALIPGSFVFSVAFEYTIFMRRKKGCHVGGRPRVGTRFVFLAAMVLLVVGAVSASWPPFYARLPGPYELGGRDRSVDQFGMTTAEWAANNLPRGAVVAGDITNTELFTSIGSDNIPAGYVAAYLILTSKASPLLTREIRSSGIKYVVADQRIATSIPVAGNPIFEYDPYTGYYARPIPVASVAKFAGTPGVSRLFDDGPISVYDLTGSSFASR